MTTTPNCSCLACDPMSGEIGLECKATTPNGETENKPDLSEILMLNEKYALNNAPNVEVLKSCPRCKGEVRDFCIDHEETVIMCFNCNESWRIEELWNADTEATALVEKLAGTMRLSLWTIARNLPDGQPMPCWSQRMVEDLAEATAWLGKKGDV